MLLDIFIYMNQPIIEIKNLSKSYKISQRQPYETFRDSVTELIKKPFRLVGNGAKIKKEEFWALRDINLFVPQGEKLGIIGRNGAGKSTLLKILSQITPPTRGQIYLHGRVASLLEVGTGFHPELTGRENIFLNGAILGMRQAEIRKKFDEIVEFAEIGEFLDTPVKRYSSGMYVRLAFAVAAHLEAEVLIIDEVLAVGDFQFQKKCLGKMQDVARGGRTILFVSHNMGAIKQLCNKCILLDKGKIITIGNPQNVIEFYLGNQIQKSTIYEKEHDNKNIVNLRKVILNPNKKNVSNNISYDEDFLIRIEYEINKPISDCTVWFAIQTIDGIMAFTSADYDLNPLIRDKRTPGYNQSDIKIPGKWLNTGQYIIIVGIVKNTPLIIYERTETITFNIVDNGTTPNAAFKDGTRRGILQPFLKWDNRKI